MRITGNAADISYDRLPQHEKSFNALVTLSPPLLTKPTQNFFDDIFVNMHTSSFTKYCEHKLLVREELRPKMSCNNNSSAPTYARIAMPW